MRVQSCNRFRFYIWFVRNIAPVSQDQLLSMVAAFASQRSAVKETRLWFLFLSQELGEKRQRTSLFSYRTSVLHIFVRPNESKSGTSFKVFVIEPAVVNYPGLDIVILQLNRGGQDDGCVCCRSWKILAYQSAFLVSGVKPSATRNHWGQLGRWRIWKVAFKVPIAKISTHTEALYDASACTKLQSVQVLYLIC